MRIEDLSPRSILLASVAGWAILAWLLALLGMGGRVSPLPEDPSLLQPLPQPAPAPEERLGPFSEYGAVAARPLFSEDRRPQPFSLGAGDEEEDNGFDYVLTSVIIAPGLQMAMLQPTGADGEAIRVKLGEASEQAAAWRLVALEPRRAVFEGPDGELVMDLRAFDGAGGQPATPPTSPPPRDPATAGARPGQALQPATGDEAVEAAADAAKSAADAAATAQAAAQPTPAPPAPNPRQSSAATTPDAQIEAIRKRIQERRAQLRREAEQQQSNGNNP